MTDRLVVIVTWFSLFAIGSPAGAGAGAGRLNLAHQQEARLQSYLDCVSLFRAGRLEDGVVRLLGRGDDWLAWTLHDVESAVRARDERLGVQDIEAAILLHLRAFRKPGVLTSVMRDHLSAARRLAAAAGNRLPHGFLRDCRLLVIWFLQGQLDIENVIRQLDEALHEFPDDDELLVSQGSVWEWLAAEPDADTMRFPENRVTSAIAIRPPAGQPADGRSPILPASSIYERCARLYERVLRRPPALDDARLRLGRVLLQVNRPEEALHTLEPLAIRDAANSPRELRYLAALFQGRAWLAAGKAEPAIVAYRRALSLYPGCQTPQVALSSALRTAGDRAGSQTVMAGLLAGARRSACTRDPWLGYLTGQTWRLDALVLRLEDGVRR